MTGEWKGISEKEIYDRIRNEVMFLYHQARQKQELIAPQVTACVPILPAEDASLLGLPEGIGIEFIDLPGLKSIQDRDNLKVIQQQVHKAFSLAVIGRSPAFCTIDTKVGTGLLNCAGNPRSQPLMNAN